MRGRPIIVAALALLVAALSACGGSSSAGTSTSTASTGRPVGGTTIQIRDYAFSPASLQVKVGSTVTVTNADDVAHTLTAKDKSFDTGRLEPGKSATVTLRTTGTFAYVCSFHPYMQGTIQVTS